MHNARPMSQRFMVWLSMTQAFLTSCDYMAMVTAIRYDRLNGAVGSYAEWMILAFSYHHPHTIDNVIVDIKIVDNEIMHNVNIDIAIIDIVNIDNRTMHNNIMYISMIALHTIVLSILRLSTISRRTESQKTRLSCLSLLSLSFVLSIHIVLKVSFESIYFYNNEKKGLTGIK